MQFPTIGQPGARLTQEGLARLSKSTDGANNKLSPKDRQEVEAAGKVVGTRIGHSGSDRYVADRKA